MDQVVYKVLLPFISPLTPFQGSYTYTLQTCPIYFSFYVVTVLQYCMYYNYSTK